MIWLYSGTPGSGKSLNTARLIITRARFGAPVVGNFPTDLSRYKRANYTYLPNDEITPERLEQISKDYFKGEKVREGAIVLILDECQLLFNAREWQKTGRAEWLSFFTQHRKLGYDIILVAQFDRMIDRQIRSLIEYELIHRKMSNFGIQGRFLQILMGGNGFCAVKMWYPLQQKISSEFFRVKRSYYRIYDSYGTFSASAKAELTERSCEQTEGST